MKWSFIFIIGLILFGIIRLHGADFLPKYIADYYNTSPTITPSPHPLDPLKVLTLINDHRKSKGLGILSFDESMCKFANTRLEQIKTNYSHDGFYPAVKKAYEYTYAGENLASGYTTEDGVVYGWIMSPKHLENIENPHYTRSCVASGSDLNNPNLKVYTVQEFAGD